MRSLAAALGADPSPVNPLRVMRLAGSVAWPKSHKPGRVAELVTLDVARDGAVTLAEVEAAAACLTPETPQPAPSALQTPLGCVDKRDSQSAITMIQGWKLGASHDPRPDRHRSLGADRPVSAA
jgi:hypothetical protein